MRPRYSLVLFGLIVLAACGRRAEPPAPTPVVIAPLPPTPIVIAPPLDWTDRPATAGDWSYGAEARGSVARFTGPGTGFAMRCDRAARRVTLERGGVLDPGRTAQLTMRSSTTARSLPLANTATTPPTVGATLPATDPLLDSIAYTRGRFLVQTEGAPDLVLPAYAEVARVIEDCRD